MVRLCSVGTLEYEADIGKLALRRLAAEYPQDAGIEKRLIAQKDAARLRFGGKATWSAGAGPPATFC